MSGASRAASLGALAERARALPLEAECAAEAEAWRAVQRVQASSPRVDAPELRLADSSPDDCSVGSPAGGSAQDDYSVQLLAGALVLRSVDSSPADAAAAQGHGLELRPDDSPVGREAVRAVQHSRADARWLALLCWLEALPLPWGARLPLDAVPPSGFSPPVRRDALPAPPAV